MKPYKKIKTNCWCDAVERCEFCKPTSKEKRKLRKQLRAILKRDERNERKRNRSEDI